MLGAGVFSGMWAQVMAAGSLFLLAIVIAAGVAIANALATAQLAAHYPVAGGAYAYGRAELGPTAGLIAGVAFLLGKTASVAVGAVVLATYVLPGSPHVTATVAILACWAFNARGITRTAMGATVIGAVVSAVLLALVSQVLLSESSFGYFVYAEMSPSSFSIDTPGSWDTVLGAAAAAFFAFAGYARIATLGEEVREPQRTIPRAIIAALVWVLVIYLALAAALGHELVRSPAGDAEWLTEAPVHKLAGSVGMPAWLLMGAAVLAVAGAMLGVMAGAGRTAMAMARHRDLPGGLAHRGASGAPWRAELVVAACAIALVWTPGVSLLLVSVASILIYYTIANVAAFVQRRAGRVGPMRVPVWIPVAGVVGSVVLGATAWVNATDGLVPAMVMLAIVVGWPLVARAVRNSATPR